MRTIKKYQGPAIVIALAILLIEFPMIAAVIVSGLLIIIALIWIKLIKGHSHFANGGNTSDFETRFYEKGEPGFKNLTVTIFDYYKKSETEL